MEGWSPSKDVDDLQSYIKGAVKGQGLPPAAVDTDPVAPIGHVGPPPTFFETNKFTSIFQGIVDTYGVPRYKEVNPGLFTIVTFPFLFGVMYGDIGHGTLLSLFGFWLLYNEAKFMKMHAEGRMGDIDSMVFGGRYVITMMGLFGLYCGFIYNDCFSVPFHLAESHWRWNEENQEYESTGNNVYPFGIDPIWYHKSNELIFFNSLKMKLAVTLGVIHMTSGILLSLSNHIYFRDWLSIFFEFIPRIIFMIATFGYMIIIIIYKFTIDWTTATVAPPSLIQTMIKMFLSPGIVTDDVVLYSGQANIQVFLLVIALISVPIMLCAKPLIHKHQHRHDVVESQQVKDEEPEDEEIGDLEEKKHHPAPGAQPPAHPAVAAGHAAGGGGGHGEGPYDFSDDFIHTAIHTIEFVLGTVSNTASYLRLWALSLAHAELADVFWSKMIQEFGVDTGNPFMVFVGFAVWCAATFGVLMCMDVLECFLHALRLHWVEFQNKFFNADGYAFKPFTLEDKDEE